MAPPPAFHTHRHLFSHVQVGGWIQAEANIAMSVGAVLFCLRTAHCNCCDKIAVHVNARAFMQPAVRSLASYR